MSINFFEIQYLITDSFYFEVLVHEHSYEQAAGICHQAFYEYIVSDTITSIVTVALLIKLKLRHKLQMKERDIEDMKRVLDLSKTIEYKKLLNEDESEYLEEYIELVKSKYKELAGC